MAEFEGRFSKGRLEAFSDGVIAVIITIMVLDLKAPESAELPELLKLWPSFLIYLLSYGFVAIYWINHHNLLSQARVVTTSLIWVNSGLLFSLSLIPFATAYVAATNIAPLPTFVYGALQLVCALAFRALGAAILAQRRDEPVFVRHAAARRTQDYGGLAVYAFATAIAAFSPLIAVALFVAVALAYVVPGLVAERVERKGAR
jgi:uncharacterized membrane protein